MHRSHPAATPYGAGAAGRKRTSSGDDRKRKHDAEEQSKAKKHKDFKF